MFEAPEAVIERVVARFGEIRVDNPACATTQATGFSSRRIAPSGVSLFDFALPAARSACEGLSPDSIKAVIAATFSSEQRFPALSVRIASALGLGPSTAAFDLQLACSAYPYAVYLASRMACDLGGKVLVIDADLQSRFLDENDQATTLVMDDSATASIVSANPAARSSFDFLSSYSEALACPADGPIGMDGFKVFSFVATDIARFLRPFGTDFDMFVPHRANMYMIRRLAKTLGLTEKLVAPEGQFANPGSASVPATVALAGRPGRALIAAFGAGFSAAAACVALPDSFSGSVVNH